MVIVSNHVRLAYYPFIIVIVFDFKIMTDRLVIAKCIVQITYMEIIKIVYPINSC